MRYLVRFLSSLLIKEENIDRKPPPILVRPCIEPIKIKINFLYFKIFFLKEKKLFLFNTNKDEIIKIIEA